MSSGGPRNRSGPQADPNSGRSEQRGITLVVLPTTAPGRSPAFPFPRMLRHRWEFEDKRKFQVIDWDDTKAFRARELALWRQAWKYPQANVWRREPWRWHAIAMWVRTHVICEGDDATAADKGSLHRFADQIGMTPAGLRENGWTIAVDQVGAKRATRSPAPAAKRERRLRSVDAQ